MALAVIRAPTGFKPLANNATIKMNMHKNMIRLVAGAVLFLLAREAPGALSVPLALNYQGRLQLGQDVLTPGAYGLEFRLWNAPSGGTLLWARAISSVYVSSNGVFSATLKNDAGAELPPPCR